MLDAFDKLPSGSAILNIVGVDNLPAELKENHSVNIYYLGLKVHSEIPQILSESDVMLFPSLSDGFGLAAAEGMATGCPIITSKNSGIADIVTDGVNGFVIPAQSVEALYEKMYWFIINKKEINQMGIEARKEVEKLTKDNYKNKILDAFNIICESKFS